MSYVWLDNANPTTLEQIFCYTANRRLAGVNGVLKRARVRRAVVLSSRNVNRIKPANNRACLETEPGKKFL